MKFFVMSEEKITAVISANDDTHLKSAKFIPASSEAINTYREWLTKHPNQQPKLSTILNAPPEEKKESFALKTKDSIKPASTQNKQQRIRSLRKQARR